MTAPIKILKWTFGPKLNERQRRELGVNGHHAGCWINDYDCGDPDCVMARYDERPAVVVLEEVREQ